MEKIVSENIGKLMALKGLSQQGLADNLELSRNTINKITSFKRDSNPKISTLIKVAKALDIDFPQLFIREMDSSKSFDNEMSLEKYMNIFIQNTELRIRGKKRKILSSDPGVQESTVSEILNGKNLDPKISTLYAISEQLDVRLGYLFIRGGDLI